MRYLFLLLLAALPPSLCAAQNLVVSRGGSVCRAHDKLTLELDPMQPVGGILAVESDLAPGVKYYSPVKYEEQQRSMRRSIQLRKPYPSPPVVLVNRRCNLGEFEEPGLYQVRLSQPKDYTLFSYFAYSTQAPTAPATSVLLPASDVFAYQLARTYTLLDSALRHARLDTLHKAWNATLRQKWVAVLADSMPLAPSAASCPRQCTAGYDFALVLGTDNPLALLVLDDGLTGLDTICGTSHAGRRLARSLADKLLPDLLILLSDTTFSLIQNKTGKAVRLLSTQTIDTCVQTLRSMLWTSPTGPAVVQDAGFMRGELARRGVDELAAAPAFELLPTRRQFRQLKLVFRLRNTRPGDSAVVLHTASTQRMLGQANSLASLAASPDSSRLYLLAEKCDLLFTLDTRRETLLSQRMLTEPGGPTHRQLKGAAMWLRKALLLSDELTGRVLVCDLRTTSKMLRVLPSGSTLGADVGDASNEGIAADARRQYCYLLKEQVGNAYGLLRRFKVSVDTDTMPTSLALQEELHLDFPLPVAGARWRYTDLVYDGRYNRLLALKSTYTGRPGPANKYLIEAIRLDEQGQLVHDMDANNHPTLSQKPETLVNLSNFINAYAACYNTAIEGLSIANGWLYLVAASPEPPAGTCGRPAKQPALLFKWPLY